MKKIFFEHNFLRKKLFEKFNDSVEDKMDNEEEKFEYLRYLLYAVGKSYYVPQNVDFNDLVEKLADWFTEQHKLKVEKLNVNDIQVLKTSASSKVAKMLGLSRPMALILDKNENYLSFMFLPPEWFDSPQIDKKLEKTGFFSNLFVDNIEKFIFEYLHEHNPNKSLLEFASSDNYFVENFLPKHQQFFLAEREENEVLLAWLSVSSLKKLAQNKDFAKNVSWFYLLTNYDSLLLGFDKNGDVVDAFELQNRAMTVKKSIRTTIMVDSYEWTATMSNASLYKDIAPCLAFDENMRLSEVAKLNVSSSKNYKYYDYAKFLLSRLNDVVSPLTAFVLDYIVDSNKATEDYSKNDRLNTILLNILNSSQAEELLVFWYNDWKLNLEQSVFVVKLLIEASENQQHLKEIFPLHSAVHEALIKKEKDSYNKILYNIEYCRHLIAIDKNKEAEKIIKNNLKKLPDQSILDLLPSENIDPTGDLSGRFLKVLLLELLASAQNEKASANTIRDIAMLQPLVKNRIYNLSGIADENLKERSNTILKILDGSGLVKNTEAVSTKYKVIESDEIEAVKHSSIQKKGMLSSFSKWISSYKIPDFSTVKKYADRFSPTKHEQVADIIADLLHFFNFENLEVFIAHGEYSVSIRAYEAETPFLLIGNDHLNPDSPFYLTYNELRFVLASELAFLYFKFSRITSSDIWRGTMDKGNFVLETVISLIPFAGSMTSLAKNATKIRALSTFLEKNEQISKLLVKSQQLATVSEKSTGILHVASQMMQAMNSATPKGDSAKKDELVAISRMMQITADRIGLIICNDPVSAVRSVFLSSKNLVENLTYAQKYGLNSFLLKKNDQGNYYNQNFAVRFASMFSFWLSDDFENIRKKIIDSE
ncbi:MAG: hypothetical protein JXL97_09335 [Bacteroidales bacterium]|nr:hypothetical protein [Bacteroidales bacterium]